MSTPNFDQPAIVAEHSAVTAPTAIADRAAVHEGAVQPLPPVKRLSNETWSLIFASIDRRESIKTLSLVDRHTMNLSRSMLFTTLDVDATALLQLQHLYAEATVQHRKLLLPLNVVRTLRLHFSKIALDQFFLLSTFLTLSDARPQRLQVHGYISMEAPARLAIWRSSIMSMLRARLACVRELRLVSTSNCHQDGALWMWMCPQIDVLQGSAPLGLPGPPDRSDALSEQERIGLPGLFAGPSGRPVRNCLEGCICPAETLIIGSDEDEQLFSAMKRWASHGMTFKVRRLVLQDVLCIPTVGCPHLQPVLMACSATLAQLEIQSVSDQGASPPNLPQLILNSLDADTEQGWGAPIPDPDGRATIFPFAPWFSLPKLERLTLPFYSLGMWARLLERVGNQEVQLILTDWHRSGAEKSGGTASHRLSAAISTLKALQSASVTILVMTAADKLNAHCFLQTNLPNRSNVQYTVLLKD